MHKSWYVFRKKRAKFFLSHFLPLIYIWKSVFNFHSPPFSWISSFLLSVGIWVNLCWIFHWNFKVATFLQVWGQYEQELLNNPWFLFVIKDTFFCRIQSWLWLWILNKYFPRVWRYTSNSWRGFTNQNLNLLWHICMGCVL